MPNDSLDSLSFVATKAGKRSFWSPPPARGNWLEDLATGRRLGREFLAAGAHKPYIFGWIVRDMISHGSSSGIEHGFAAEVARAAGAPMAPTITTVDELIEHLGGDVAVAEWIGVTEATVATWKRSREIPPGLHYRFSERSRLLGREVDASVFKND